MNIIRCILILLTLVKSFLCSPDDIVCNNKTYDRHFIGCCIQENGTEIKYNRTTKFCCGYILYDMEKYYKCCGLREKKTSERYHIIEQKCCNGKVFNYSGISKITCCGAKTYNPDIQRCIGNEILLPHESICNGTKFNLHNNYCCNGKLTGQKIQPGAICCGHKLMIINNNICCEGVRFLKEFDTTCCGKEVVNKTDACCNGKKYNPALDRCIDGKITNSTYKTCNSKTYDSETQVCCQYSIINKTEDDQDSCCQGSLRPKIPYNSKTEICTNKGDIQSTIHCDGVTDSKKYTCCQDLRYNKPSNESMCCKNIRKKKPAKGIPDGCQSSLCGNEMYNSKNNICCNDRLIRRRKYYCKNGKKFKMFNFKDGLYTKNIQICGQYAIKISNNVDCCNGMPYHKNKTKCPLKWRDKRNQLKSIDYPFWNLIQCKTLNMTGTIRHVISNSKNIFTIHFESKKNYKVKVHVSNPSQQNKLMENSNNEKTKTIYVFYKKKSGKKITLGTYGAISFAKPQSINKNICRKFEKNRK